MAQGSLSCDFHTRPVPLNLLLANRLRGAATDGNLERILSETKLGVNRRKKILKVIRLSQADIIIAETTTSHPKTQRRRRGMSPHRAPKHARFSRFGVETEGERQRSREGG